MTEEHPLARRLDDGRILLRHFGEESEGDITDGSLVIGPQDPAYQDWDAEITRWEHRPRPLDDSGDYEPIDCENLRILSDTLPDGHDRALEHRAWC